MAKKPPEVRLPPCKYAAHEHLTANQVQEVFEVSDGALLEQKLNEIAKLLLVHEDASDKTTHQRAVRALELYESLEPSDGAGRHAGVADGGHA